MSSPEIPPTPEREPAWLEVQRYLLYGLSIPERAIRSSSGVVGGALRESATLLVPRAFRSSKTYSIFVQQMLDFMAEDIGGVTREAEDEGTTKVENYVARKTVGNFIEMAGLVTLHTSPLTILAIISDVAYGSQEYLRELSDELKQHGVIDPNSTIDHVHDLLTAVGQTSSTAATAFDTPPLSYQGLKKTIEETRSALEQVDPTRVIPQAELQRLWGEMKTVAKKERVDLIGLSSAVTLETLERVGNVGWGAVSGLTVAGRLVDRHIVDHYQEAITAVAQKGIYASLADTSGPYIQAVWQNFSGRGNTWTEYILTCQWWPRVAQLLRRKPPDPPSTIAPSPPEAPT